MDYQEAIKVLHYATLSGGHPKDLCDMKAVATLAMQELQEYKKLGTLEEVREAVEKQNECKNCGYKIHSNRISELNSCNDCGLANICEKRPKLGQYCRINCYDWSGKNE